MPIVIPPPPTPVTVVTIGGTTMALPRDLLPDRLIKYCRGGTPSFSFSVRGGKLVSPDPYRSKLITVTMNGVLVFTGRVQSPKLVFRPGVGWVRQYQCVSSRDFMDWIRHTDSNDLSTNSDYNQSRDAQAASYVLARSGRTVGQILRDVLTMTANAQALNAVGLGNYTGLPSAPALPSSTVADLAALVHIPPTGLSFGGDKLGSAVDAFVEEYAPNHFFSVEPDGTFRFLDQRSFTAHTLTMGADKIDPVELSTDTSRCAAQVWVSGAAVAEMRLFDLLKGTLNEAPFAHDGLTVAQAKSKWVPNDWFSSEGLAGGNALAIVSGMTSGAVATVAVSQGGYGYTPSSTAAAKFVGGAGAGAAGHGVTDSTGAVVSFSVTAGGSGYTSTPDVVLAAPGGANADSGSCVCSGTTTVTVTSVLPGANFPANYWDQTSTGRHGTVFLSYSSGTNVDSQATRAVVSNTALAPGGTATLTLDRPLPSTLFDGYAVRGLSKNASSVWVLYGLPSWAGPLVAQESTYPFPFKGSGGESETLTSYPMGVVVTGASPPYQEQSAEVVVDAGAGTVRFGNPTFLTAGGVPVNVQALVPIYTGVNQVFSPAPIAGVPQYAGTYHTVDGQTRVLPIYAPAWRDPGNTAAMQTYADYMLDAVKDIVYEGVVVVHGLYTTALTLGTALNIAGNGFTTGWEAGTLGALPVLECEVKWPPEGPDNWVTSMRVSNRRGPVNVEAFLPPDRTGVNWDWGVSFGLASPTISATPLTTVNDLASSVSTPDSAIGAGATPDSLIGSAATPGSAIAAMPNVGDLAPDITPDASAGLEWARQNAPLLGGTYAPSTGWKVDPDSGV